MELHRPGCDRCWPCCISSSACSGDRVSGVLRARRARGVRFWRWRRRQGRSRVRVATCIRRLLVIMQRQVLQSCTDSAVTSGWCLSLSSSTEWTVYEMACFLCFPLLCTETGTHSAFFLAGFGVLQYIDKVVDVGDAGLLGIWTLFPRAPCSGSHLPLCGATVHGCFWKNFVYFHVKSGLRAPRAVLTLEI